MTPLGTFPVAATHAEVAAFRAATGLEPGDGVPAAFPIRWLAAPELRDALLALAPGDDLVPVHESQLFEYFGPLIANERYAMELVVGREASPERLVLAGTIRDAAGAPLVHVETILRLFSASAAK